MLFKQLFLAAAASALLVVPDMSTEVIDPAPIPESETAPIQPPNLLLDQSLELPCKQCRGRDTNLRLDFAVENGTKLTLNGFELYPEADPWNGDLVTTMVKEDGREGKQRLGYSLLIVPLAFDEDQQLELIDLVFRVIEVGNRPVDKVPIVKLGLIRTKTDEIIIGNMQLIEPARQHCTTAWCQFKATIHDALRGLIRASGCGRFKSHGHAHAHAHAHAHGHGAAHGHANGHANGHGALPGSMTDANGNRHDHHRHDHHHHHHAESYYSAKTHTRARLLRSIISHVVLPVVVGVTAGVSLAFVGIFVCGIVYRIITAFRRRCPRAHVAGCPRARSPLRRERSADAEKQRLMDDEESQESTPPAYRDAVQE